MWRVKLDSGWQSKLQRVRLRNNNRSDKSSNWSGLSACYMSSTVLTDSHTHTFSSDLRAALELPQGKGAARGLGEGVVVSCAGSGLDRPGCEPWLSLSSSLGLWACSLTPPSISVLIYELEM